MFWRKKPQAVEKKEVPAGIAPLSVNHTPKWTNDFNELGSVIEGYQGNSWVYACVKKRADAVASVPVVVEQKTNDGWEQVENHPLQLLLDRPNADYDTSEMMRMFVTHLDLMGNSLLLKVKAENSGKIIALWPLMPQWTTPVAGRIRLIDRYRYGKPNSQLIEYSQDQVIHAAYTNPDNLVWGQSPLAAGGKAVDIDNEAKAFQKNSFENRGINDGIFSFDGEASSEELANIQQTIKENYQGSRNARKPLLASKMKYQSLGMTPAEMDFMQTREFTLKEIAAVYGVPIEMISGMGDSNRASSETVRKTFWVDTIEPLLSELETALNLQLTPDYGKNIRIRFDRSKVPALQDSLSDKLNVAERLYKMGVPFNQLNEKLELGFEPIVGGDIGYIPSGLIPVSFNYDQIDTEQAAEEAYGAINNTD
jgi:HK97 family phage portal protein